MSLRSREEDIRGMTMALEKCRECGNKVSSEAEICPSCGIKPPAKKRIGCIPSLIVVVLVFWLISNIGSGPQPDPASAPPLPTPKTAADIRNDRIKAGFSSWNGAHLGLEKRIKQCMKNPDSYEHVKTTYLEKDGGLVVITQYRGTNSFGAVITEQATARTDIDGNVVWIDRDGC